MNFDRTVTEEEIFDPESAVPRSTVTMEEQAQTRENDPGAVTVQNNLPDANLNTGGPTATSSESRTEETVNYEISKRVVNSVSEGGEVKRLSIAVLVDGTYEIAEDGTRHLHPALGRGDGQDRQPGSLCRGL